jgi:hypothetical protein
VLHRRDPVTVEHTTPLFVRWLARHYLPADWQPTAAPVHPRPCACGLMEDYFSAEELSAVLARLRQAGAGEAT